MGIAMGCIGMRLKDFERCTPSEFKTVFDRWKEREDMKERGEWERIRMECLCVLQPYSKNKLHAYDIMEFPWEKTPAEQPQESMTISHEDEMKRFEAAKRRFGLK